MKKFCIAGPVDPKRHYFIPKRLDYKEVMQLIEDREYFVLHAPRQSGKTTAVQEVTALLNKNGLYSAVYVNIESAQAARENVKEALLTIIELLHYAMKKQFPDEKETGAYFDALIRGEAPITLNSLQLALAFWASRSQKPLVLFIDEIDSLIGDSLLSVLRQIRSGYTQKPNNFPESICLIGLRDVRDYKIYSGKSDTQVSTSSPFNIKAKSILLPNFSQQEVAYLYNQHTAETGQIFEESAIEHAYDLTQGQPWLVNALAHEAAFVQVPDRKQNITKEVIDRAKNTLIKRRDTHLDSLIDKLQENRVFPIIDAIINGKTDLVHFDTQSMQYVRDLGLIKSDRMEITNPIYQEIIPRELTTLATEGLAEKFVNRTGYVRKDGSLDMQVLLEAFYEFYRENSAIWLEKFAYKESGPHLLLMAFLQRIINGGGTIYREYALGRGRVDLIVSWQKQRIVLELKVKRGEKTLAEGLEQTAKYMDTASATEGYLLIFDRDPKKSWQEKFRQSQEIYQSHTIDVWQI